ncbi:MAG: hypothetical protein ACOC9Y_05035, partial [Chloroflexota bacterium]
VVLYVEPLAVQLLTLLPGDVDRLDVLLISTNVNGLLNANGTVQSMEGMNTVTTDVPSQLQSLTYVIVVSLASAAVAILAVTRRDIEV